MCFYDVNPSGGETRIGSCQTVKLNVGETREVQKEWDLNGNITGHQLKVQAKYTGGELDPNPSNNILLSPMSVYYVDFRHDRDTYSFANGEIGKVPVSEYFSFYKDFDVPELFWMPLLPFFGVIFEFSGYCSGMANSSLVYFSNPNLKPNPIKPTFDHSLEEARGKIRTYQWYTFRNFMGYFMGLYSSDPVEQYNQTLSSIKSGQAVIHALMDNRNGAWPQGNHAVVAYKIVDLGQEKRVFYYDSNLPLKSLSSGQVETYGIFDKNGFSEPFYPQQDPPVVYNKAYVFEAQESASDTARFLREFIRWVFTFHNQRKNFSLSVTGNIALMATDSTGRRTGYNSLGQKLTEIPNSQLISLNGGQALILPVTSTYRFDIADVQIGTSALVINATNFSVSIFDPLTDQEARALEFTDISLSPGSTGSFTFQHDQTISTMVLSTGEAYQSTVHILKPLPTDLFLPLVLR